MSKITPEWSHKIRSDKISSEPETYSIKADEQQRKDLSHGSHSVAIFKVNFSSTGQSKTK